MLTGTNGRRWKIAWVALLAAALMLLAAGCGGGQPPASGGAGDATGGGQPGGEQGAAGGGPQAPQTNEEIFLYKGSDRDDVLLQGAQKEGQVNWYTDDNTATAEEVTSRFEAKYPGIHVEVYRGTSDDVLNKVISEARGGVRNFDVVNATVDTLMAVEEAGLVADFYTPVAERLVKGLVHPGPERARWVAPSALSYVIVYHTGLVQPGEVPERMDYEDLSDPRWKGRLGIDGRDWVVYGTLARALGEERAQRIVQGWAANEPLIRSGHALMSQTQAAGEFAITPTQYLHIAVRERNAGAQLDWRFPTSGMITVPKSAYLAKDAPHPHAAMLLLEFLLSEEIQNLYGQESRVTALPGLAAEVPREVYDNLIVVDAADLAANQEEYQSVWDQHFLER